ncbi:MAG: sulfotransferase [Gammaproteobacteria bacterium]|nr:sulfotransferase [Gammaproteobacteria bacterium]
MGVPNFLIIGAEKAGTTALYHYLKLHPEIYMSPIKEPNFFSTDIEPRLDQRHLLNPKPDKVLKPKGEYRHLAFIRDPHLYQLLFQGSESYKAVGEASTSYLYSLEAATNIYKYNPNMKIIAILRNPLSRLISAYKMEVNIGRINEPLNVALNLYPELVERSLYANQIKRYLEKFPPTSILVLTYDEFAQNNKATLRKVLSFLEVSTMSTEGIGHLRINEAKYPKYKFLNSFLFKTGIKRLVSSLTPPPLKERFKRLYYTKKPTYSIHLDEDKLLTLVDIFLKDIEALEKLLRIDFANWKEDLQNAVS